MVCPARAYSGDSRNSVFGDNTARFFPPLFASSLTAVISNRSIMPSGRKNWQKIIFEGVAFVFIMQLRYKSRFISKLRPIKNSKLKK